MSSLFKQFEMDAQKESEGIDITFAANDDGTVPTFRVLRRGNQNQKYVKSLERATQPYKRLIALEALDAKTQERILRRVFCEAVLIGWDHVQDKDNKDIPYNFENAIGLFNALPELYMELASQASQLAAFRVETQESDAKN